METSYSNKHGTSSSKGEAWKVVGDQPASNTPSTSCIATRTLTPQSSQQGPVFASLSEPNPSQEHCVLSSSQGSSSIDIPGFDKRSYGHPSQPPAVRKTGQSSNAPDLKQAGPSFSREDKSLNNVRKEAATNSSWVDVHSGKAQLMTHPSSSHDRGIAQNMSTRASDKKAATYDSLKQEGESPESVIKRLQENGLREANVRMRRKAKGETVNTGLATLDFLRRPISPAFTEHLMTSNGTTPLNTGVVSEDQNTPKRRQPNAQREEHISKEPAEWKVVHGSQTFSPEGLNNVRAEADDPSEFAVPDASGNPIDSATSRGIHNSSDEIDSAQTNTNPTSQPSLVKTPYQPSAARRRRGTCAQKWARSWEMKPPSFHPDSNAEGTETSNDDSITPMAWANDGENGTVAKRREPPNDKCDLIGWDGQMQPPPVDWESRAQYHSSNPNFISGLEGWLGANTVRMMHKVRCSLQPGQLQDSSSEFEFEALPVEQVQDITRHPDGIGFVSRGTVLTKENARYFGWVEGGELPELESLPDFEAVTILDTDDFETMKYREETADKFVTRTMQHHERQQTELEARRVSAENTMTEIQASPEPFEPKPLKTNIYLRPAVRSDYPGMTRIYNWHIEHGVRPSELQGINEDDMELRHNISTTARLPFIVAVQRNRKNAKRKPSNHRVNPDHSIQNTDPAHNAVVNDENIIGWACATDWTASHYVETTTAELEIYVAPNFRQNGVGRCLMDALLDATDRGHVNKGGYDFHAAPEIRHLYNSGGGRDLSKIIFQVRSFSNPITPEHKHRLHLAAEASKDWVNAGGSLYGRANGLDAKRKAAKPREEKKDFSKAARIDDREDDYSIWLKEWLESFGFEEEASIKKVGAKDKRLVDVRYLTKETAWQPVDNQIPDFRNGY
ncbi:uncharacterized protein PV06_01870 [Exophiala oligosperma]|uniref:N-acetyltransferase domain-containing protein n=1 Tax=Exophiala oligosperma TaxID=215243 RepID=A0A0D2EE34_9EURO|nr:uncharacterized protein PV06_01870 [Exophiala oligosperma]KIW46184.1 hypothetical protein PV06_01870 [Exophiala oligosperma]